MGNRNTFVVECAKLFTNEIFAFFSLHCKFPITWPQFHENLSSNVSGRKFLGVSEIGIQSASYKYKWLQLQFVNMYQVIQLTWIKWPKGVADLTWNSLITNFPSALQTCRFLWIPFPLSLGYCVSVCATHPYKYPQILFYLTPYVPMYGGSVKWFIFFLLMKTVVFGVSIYWEQC